MASHKLRDLEHKIVATLAANGATHCSFSHTGGNHKRVDFVGPDGKELWLTYSLTPNGHVGKKVASEIRRLIRTGSRSGMLMERHR